MRGSRAAVAAVVVVVLVAAAWVVLSWSAARDVRVAWSYQSPSCSGTTVHRVTARSVIVARPGMDCTVVVTVANESRVGVHLGRATAAYLGPDTGMVVAADHPDGSDDTGIDAVFLLDRSVGAGRTGRVRMRLRFHPSGCNDSGTSTVTHVPVVEVRVLGIPHQREAADALRIRHTGRTPGCDLG